jgi:hypothetical protein
MAPFVGWALLRGVPRGRAVHLLLLAVVLLAALFPWAYRNHREFGRWIWSTSHGGITFYQGNNRVVWEEPRYRGGVAPLESLPRWEELQSHPETVRDSLAWAWGWEFVRNHPGRALELSLWRLQRFWRFRSAVGLSGLESGWWWRRGNLFDRLFKELDVGWLYAVWVLPSFLVGLILSWRRAATLVPLYGAILCHSAVAFVFFGSLRMRAPIEPVLAIFAAFAWARFFGRVRPSTRYEEV